MGEGFWRGRTWGSSRPAPGETSAGRTGRRLCARRHALSEICTSPADPAPAAGPCTPCRELLIGMLSGLSTQLRSRRAVGCAEATALATPSLTVAATVLSWLHSRQAWNAFPVQSALCNLLGHVQIFAPLQGPRFCTTSTIAVRGERRVPTLWARLVRTQRGLQTSA